MRNEARKNEYFTGDLKEEIIERKESLRDLGVQLTDGKGFGEQIETVCKWLAFQNFNRNKKILKQVVKCLVNETTH